MAASPAAAPRLPGYEQVYARPAAFEKIRFLFDMGTALFAFHHFVYAPFLQGGFLSTSPNRVGNFARAAVALAFSYHQLKAADKVAHQSKNALLLKLVAPLDKLLGSVGAEQTQLQHGQYKSSDISSVEGQIGSFNKLATGNGYSIHDIPTPIPSMPS